MKPWLVEQNPAVAAGYIAPPAFACLETGRGAPVDRGVARFQFVAIMQAVNARIGKIDVLAQAAEGVSLTGPRGKEIPQSNRDAFVMYDLRDDLAQSFDCENRVHSEETCGRVRTASSASYTVLCSQHPLQACGRGRGGGAGTTTRKFPRDRVISVCFLP